MRFTDEDQQTIDKWTLKKNLGKNTIKTYLTSLEEYCKLLNRKPAELIKEAIQEERQGVYKEHRKIESYLLQYLKSLKETKAPSTQNLYMSAIKSFYKSHGLELPEITLQKGDMGLEENYGRELKKEELRKMVEISAPREKALLYLMHLSGMSQAEARHLTIRKYLEVAGEEINFYLETLEDLFKYENKIVETIIKIEIVRRKVNYRYITFIPPESSRAIIAYLRERVHGRNLKIRPRSIDEPIFVKNYGVPMNQDDVGTNIKRIGFAAGLKKKPGAYAHWRPHSGRKRFISTIINELDNPLAADFMAGHKIPEMRRRYWFSKPQKLRKIYMKALPFLSIDGVKTVTLEDEESKEIQEKAREQELINKQLEERIKSLESEQHKTDKKALGIEKLARAIKNNPRAWELIMKDFAGESH